MHEDNNRARAEDVAHILESAWLSVRQAQRLHGYVPTRILKRILLTLALHAHERGEAWADDRTPVRETVVDPRLR